MTNKTGDHHHHGRSHADPAESATSTGEAGAPEAAGAPTEQPTTTPGAPDGTAASEQATGADTEADILRGELKRLREQSEALQDDLKEANDRVLRSRAEMETMRRRLLGEVDSARETGRDEAITPVLAVYDDLERALAVAAESADPGSIVTGVQLVKENLERQLASMGIVRVGHVGDHFDPHLHEALTTIPAAPGLAPGTIAQVFEPGFVHGERLVRVARVVVVADHQAN